MKKTIIIFIVVTIVIIAGYISFSLWKHSTLSEKKTKTSQDSEKNWKTLRSADNTYSMECPWSSSYNEKFISCDKVVTMGGAMSSVDIRTNSALANSIITNNNTYHLQKQMINGVEALLYIANQPGNVSSPECYILTKNNQTYYVTVSSSSWTEDKDTIDKIINTIKIN